jgi:hypothetical protein
MKQIKITEIAKVKTISMVKFTRSDCVLELGHAAGPKTSPPTPKNILGLGFKRQGMSLSMNHPPQAQVSCIGSEDPHSQVLLQLLCVVSSAIVE